MCTLLNFISKKNLIYTLHEEINLLEFKQFKLEVSNDTIYYIKIGLLRHDKLLIKFISKDLIFYSLLKYDKIIEKFNHRFNNNVSLLKIYHFICNQIQKNNYDIKQQNQNLVIEIKYENNKRCEFLLHKALIYYNNNINTDIFNSNNLIKKRQNNFRTIRATIQKIDIFGEGDSLNENEIDPLNLPKSKNKLKSKTPIKKLKRRNWSQINNIDNNTSNVSENENYCEERKFYIKSSQIQNSIYEGKYFKNYD